MEFSKVIQSGNHAYKYIFSCQGIYGMLWPKYGWSVYDLAVKQKWTSTYYYYMGDLFIMWL